MAKKFWCKTNGNRRNEMTYISLEASSFPKVINHNFAFATSNIPWLLNGDGTLKP